MTSVLKGWTTFRLGREEEEFERLKEEFKELYERTYGRTITDEEVIRILEGEEEVAPMTLKVAQMLERLADLYWRLVFKRSRGPKASP